MNQRIPSFVFRHRAWAVIKPWLQVLIVVGLLVVLPGLLSEAAGILLNDDMQTALTGPMNDYLEFMTQELPPDVDEAQLIEQANALSEAFLQAVNDFFLYGPGRIILILGAVDLLLTPVFLAPLYGALLDAQRKKELTLGGCMQYLKLGLKSLLLMVWMSLRAWVWMLPGMAAMIASLFLPAVSSLLMLGGFAASTVLGLRAMLHYILAPIVLVDKPELSLNGCIRESYRVMRNRKMEYFMLRISFIGWQLLLYLIGTIAVNQVMTAIALTLTMMGSLLLTIYINGASVVFWDAYGVPRVSGEAGAADAMRTEEPGDDLN